MILYRPVGLQELLLVYRSDMRRFPPRLPEQPIFYPVLTAQYADEIARVWNATSGDMAGYVTEFELDDEYARSLQAHQVGAQVHQEFWVPAESVGEFNGHIVGQVRVIAAHFGPAFLGIIPSSFSLKGKDARAQLETLQGIHAYSAMDFHGEVTANNEVMFLHFPFWEQLTSRTAPELAPVLAAMRGVWSTAFRTIPLGVQAPKAMAK